MSDFNYQLEALKISLAQEEEVLSVVSCTHNHKEVRARVEQLKSDIKKLEDWEKKQKPKGERDDAQYSSGPAGGV
jgi:hypothetical protein